MNAFCRDKTSRTGRESCPYNGKHKDVTDRTGVLSLQRSPERRHGQDGSPVPTTLKHLIFILTAIILFSSCLFAWADWKTIKNKDFTIFYKEGYENSAYQILNVLEQFKDIPEKITGNRIYNVPFVLEDVGQLSNGLTDPVYYNIHLLNYAEPDIENWWQLVAVHEYTHMLHLTDTSGAPAVLTTLFGRELGPNIYAPVWMTEGIAVYDESSTSKYQGRLNDGMFDACLAAEAQEKNQASILKATYGPLEFPGGDGVYEYGSGFLKYLSVTYGEDKFPKFFKLYGSSLLSYASVVCPFLGIDSTFRQIYGKTTPELWDDWQAFEADRYRDFACEGDRLTHYGWNIYGLAFSNGKLYYERYYPVKTGPFSYFSFNEIVERDTGTGREKTIYMTTSTLNPGLKVRGNKLYFTQLELEGSGYANTSYLTYAVYSMLCEIDLDTMQEREVFGDSIRSFCVLENGNILYARDIKDKTGSQIMLYNMEKRKKSKLFTNDYVIDDMASDNKRVVLSARTDWENPGLYLLDMDTGKLKELVKNPLISEEPVIYGDRMYYCANYGKKWSVYCYDFRKKKIYRVTQNGYAVNPACDTGDNRLYYSGINSGGNDIYAVNITLTPYTMEKLPETVMPVFKLNEREIENGNYMDDVATLFPQVRAPMAYEGTTNNLSTFNSLVRNIVAGMDFLSQDAIGDFNYNAQCLYDVDHLRPLFNLQLQNFFLAPLVTQFDFSNLTERFLTAGAQYPLLLRLLPGISYAYAGLNYNMIDDFSRQEAQPYVQFGFNYPYTILGFMLSTPFENRNIGSEITRNGYYISTWVEQYLPDSAITGSVSLAHDPDNPDPVLPQIRGYADVPSGRTGSEISLQYSRPIYKIRWGMWNPVNFYLEDLCGVVFSDFAATDSDTQLSGGIELHLETHLAFAVPLDLGCRLWVNKEGHAGVDALAVVNALVF